MSSHRDQELLLANLKASRARILTRVSNGEFEPAALRAVADTEAELALRLQGMPIDPVAHVRAAHAWSRPHLKRLAQHDPNVGVRIGDRVYSPRKILRRVLDHALDHLNQIDQWLAWQRDGVVPVPANGWASSYTMLDEDSLPLTPIDLKAWLWRIDVAIAMLASRAEQLTLRELDWRPPDGSWTLRQMLHHEASAERFYVAWLDDVLPEAPVARYEEANRRLVDGVLGILAHPPAEGMALINGEDMECTVDDVVAGALAAERSL